ASDVLEFGGEAETRGSRQLFGLDFQRAVAAGAQLLHPARVDVETDGVVVLAEFDRQRQADIAEADEGNAGFVQGGKCSLAHGHPAVVSECAPPGRADCANSTPHSTATTASMAGVRSG